MTDRLLAEPRRLAGLLRQWRNTVFSTLDHVWLLLLWILSTPIFIHFLGPERFGVWILINAVIGLGGAMSLGFGEATIRYVSHYRGQNRPEEVQRICNTTLSLYALIGALSGAGITAAAPAISALAFKLTGSQADEAIMALRFAGAALFVTAYLKTFEAVINGYERFDLTARVGIATRSFIILSNVALALAGYGVATLIACAVVGLAGQAVALFLMAKRRFVPGLTVLCRPDRKTIGEIASFGIQSWLQICAGALIMLADRFVVASMLGPTAAGVYTVCLQLAQQLHLLLVRGLAFMMPATSRGNAASSGLAVRAKSYESATTLVLLLVGAIALPMYILAPQILQVWVGEKFSEDGTGTLRTLTLYFAALGASVPIFFLLNGAGRPAWNTFATIAHSVVGLVLAVMLIPDLGLPGAALGRVIALPAFLVILWALHRYVLMKKGRRSSVVMFAWLSVLAVVAVGLAQILSDRVPATLPAVLGIGVMLSLLGAGLALLPYTLAKLKRSAVRPAGN